MHDNHVSTRRRWVAAVTGSLVALAIGTSAAAAPTPAANPSPGTTVGADPWPWPTWNPWPTQPPSPTSSPTRSPTAKPTPTAQPSPTGGNSKLGITELVQEKDQWCWAATGLTIAKYLGYGQNTDQNTFCLYGRGQTGGQCANQAAELSVVQTAWRKLGLRAGVEADGALAYNTVKAEINANRPIETGVYWTSGGGHARIIYGYDANTGTVLFSDPWQSNQRYQEMSYDSYVSNNEFRWGGSVYQVGA